MRFLNTLKQSFKTVRQQRSKPRDGMETDREYKPPALVDDDQNLLWIQERYRSNGAAPGSVQVVGQILRTERDKRDSLCESHKPTPEHESNIQGEEVSIAGTSKPDPQNWMRSWDIRDDKIISQFHDEDETELSKASQTLEETWHRFVERLNANLMPNQQIDLQAVPSRELVENAVSMAEDSWGIQQFSRGKSHRARAYSYFAEFVQAVDDHKDFLRILPLTDRYLCLLTGSLTALAKATINHELIEDGINVAFETVHDHMRQWKELKTLYKDVSGLKPGLLKLYVQVFRMYSDIFMRWYGGIWKEASCSFDKNFLQSTVTQRLEIMQRIEQDMRARAENYRDNHILNVLSTKQDLESMITEFRCALSDESARIFRFQNYMETILKDQAKMYMWNQIYGQKPGVRSDTGSVSDNAANLNISSSINYKNLEPDDMAVRDLETFSSDQRQQTSKLDPCTSFDASWFKMLTACLNMTVSSFEENKWPLSHNHGQVVTVRGKVLDEIQEWLKRRPLPSLWVHGPSQVSFPSQNTMIAAFLISVARRLKQPVIWHFCLNYTFDGSLRDFRSKLLLTMVCHLLAQLIPLIDEQKLSKNMASSAWAALSSPHSFSVPEAIGILRALIQARPTLLLCIIGGLELVEDPLDPDWRHQLGSFLDIIVPQGDTPDETSPVLLTFIGTDGFCTTLAELVQDLRMEEVKYELDTTYGPMDQDVSLNELSDSDIATYRG